MRSKRDPDKHKTVTGRTLMRLLISMQRSKFCWAAAATSSAFSALISSRSACVDSDDISTMKCVLLCCVAIAVAKSVRFDYAEMEQLARERNLSTTASVFDDVKYFVIFVGHP